MGYSEGKTWVFEQVGGEGRYLFLSGWAAPFGRPRQGAVVKPVLRARTERTYYPGSNTPTRHVFGVKYDDWELKGRFRDRDLGKGGAKIKTEEAKAFVRDLLPVRISWGDVLVFSGFLDELEIGYESEAEIEWTLKVSIDNDEMAATPGANLSDIPSPSDLSTDLGAALDAITAVVALTALPGSIGDLVDSAVDSFRSVTGTVRGIVDQITTFKDATFAQINRAVAGVNQLREAGVELRETLLSIPSEQRGVGQRATDIVQLQVSQATVEDQIRDSLATGAEIERGTVFARIGRIKATFVAAEGDTWEAVSSRVYGSPDRASDLREANGAPAGQNPVPGAMYLIPK